MSNPAINISVRGSSRKRFAIDGDPDRVIELNTTDLGIIKRLREALPKLQELERKISQIDASGLIEESGFNGEKTKEFTEQVESMHNEMKTLINGVFDEDVIDKCMPRGGTLLDPVTDGETTEVRYMVIINDLSSAYEEDLSAEMNKVANKRNQHTGKYTKKK